MTNEVYQKIICRSWEQITIDDLYGITKDSLERLTYEELNGLIHSMVFGNPLGEDSDPKLIQLVDWLEEILQTQDTGMIIIS